MHYCQGQKFKVLAKIPTQSSPKIRYHWGNNNWEEIEGDDYSVSVEFSSNAMGYYFGTFLKAGFGILPTCFANAWFITNLVNIPYNSIYESSAYFLDKNNNVSRFYSISESSYNLELTTIPSTYIRYTNICLTKVLQYVSGKTFIFTKYKLTQGYTFFRLKIFNQGQLVHQEDNNNPPIVEEIPGTLQFTNNWILVGTGENNYSQFLEIEENQDYSISINRGEEELFKIFPTTGTSAYPLIKIECEAVPPENLCHIVCGEWHCYFNSQGQIVEKIEVSRLSY